MNAHFECYRSQSDRTGRLTGWKERRNSIAQDWSITPTPRALAFAFDTYTVFACVRMCARVRARVHTFDDEHEPEDVQREQAAEEDEVGIRGREPLAQTVRLAEGCGDDSAAAAAAAAQLAWHGIAWRGVVLQRTQYIRRAQHRTVQCTRLERIRPLLSSPLLSSADRTGPNQTPDQTRSKVKRSEAKRSKATRMRT